MFNLNELNHQQVRDLGYSCFSEPLISAFNSIAGDNAPAHCALRLTEKRIAWLQQLDRNPVGLLRYFEQVRPRRLGFYNEALWQFFLQQDDEVELVAKNRQVQQGARSIGEFDVIYRDRKTETHVHLELAFKLYLQAPGQREKGLAQWLGPNVKDRLDLKLAHMLNHQCRLSMHEAGHQALLAMGIERVEREISLRGYLLQDGRSIHDERLPGLFNPDLQTGRWFPLSRAIPLLDRYELWVSLPRLNWISPIDPRVENSFKPQEFADFLRQHFEQSDSSIMICGLGYSEAGIPMEHFRAMVTADSWPDCRTA